MRRHNLSLVSRAVAEAPSSRTELARRTGLTKATVSSLVDALLVQGLLVEGAAPSARVGRPARTYRSRDPERGRSLRRAERAR